jgi:lysozyme family protein
MTEAEYMKEKYRKLYEVNIRCRTREANLSKKVKSLTNDILADKISFEKVKTEETEQMKTLRKLEQERDAVQKVNHSYSLLSPPPPFS